MKTIRIQLITILFFIPFISLTAQDKTARENSIKISTHKLHYYIFGSGSPAIVLDVGLADTYKNWITLLEAQSDKNQIFCYDRAGYGQSEMGDLPRNCINEADELKTLLDKAYIPGPYIIVGHSLGALNLQVFASRYSNEVAGMLLLDPPPLDWIRGNGFPELAKLAEQTTDEFEKTAESMQNSTNAEEQKRVQFFKTIASEHREMFSSSAEQAASIKSFGNIPLIVIASGKSNPVFGEDAVRFQKFWNDQCRKLSLKSSGGKYILAAESSHKIHLDDPEVILKALNELISEVR